MNLVEKVAVFLLSVAIVGYILIVFKVWSSDLGTYFFKAGRWPELAAVLVIAYVISKLAQELLKWQAKNLDSTGRPQQRRVSRIKRRR